MSIRDHSLRRPYEAPARRLVRGGKVKPGEHREIFSVKLHLQPLTRIGSLRCCQSLSEVIPFASDVRGCEL